MSKIDLSLGGNTLLEDNTGGGDLTLPEGNNFTQPALGEGATGGGILTNIAIGSKASVTNGNNIAIGQSSSASFSGITLGNNAKAFMNSIAMGFQSQAGSNTRTAFNVAIGSNSYADGVGSISIGANTKVEGNGPIQRITIGNGTKNTGDYSVVLGSSVAYTYNDTVVIQVGNSTNTSTSRSLLLFFYSSTSPLSKNTNSHAGMGFVCGGQSGCKSLAELLTDNFELV